MIFAVLERRLIQLFIKWVQFFINNYVNYMITFGAAAPIVAEPAVNTQTTAYKHN